MNEAFSRTAIQLGESAVETLTTKRVAVFGIGGVGGYTVEALARSGIGTLDLIDDDVVAVSNINRQIIATHDTIGEYKVDAAARRIATINPNAIIHTHKTFFLPQTADTFDLSHYDYIVDAIDTVAAKIALVQAAQAANVPIISCMGAGNKLDATAFQVADISKTTVCPLARVMRKELRERGIRHLKVVFSPEQPAPTDQLEAPPPGRRSVPASVAWVPSCAGLMMAGAVIQDLIQERSEPL